MTHEELRAHWGETPAPPVRTGPLPTWLVLSLIGGALLLVALWAIPGLSTENARKTESEVRVCVMQRTMSDPTIDYDTAKLLCEQP